MPEFAKGNQDEAVVLVGYASLMESVQNFEWALKRLAVQKGESMDDLSFDDAWTRAEKVLRKPMGALEGHVPDGIAQGLKRLRTIRNRLAHEVLMLWRLETNLGLATHVEVSSAFAELANEFDSLAAQLDALADKHLREHGVDAVDLVLSPQDLRKILEAEECR